MAKSIWQSKTFWVNLATLAVAVLTDIGGSDLLKEHPQAAVRIAEIVTILNIVVRFVTKEPVTLGKTPRLALLACLLCSSAVGADINLVLSGGRYHLLEKDSAGKPSLREVSVAITDLDGGPTPNPTPQPPAPTLSARSTAIRDAAARVADSKRDETAMALGLLYEALGKKSRTGELPADLILIAARSGADAVLARQGSAEAWQPVRTLLGEQWAAVQQEGGVAEDYAKLLDDASAGLRASVRPQIDPARLVALLKMIQEILALLEPFLRRGLQ